LAGSQPTYPRPGLRAAGIAFPTLIQHRHCPVCGKAILMGKETCSDECEQKQAKAQRSRKLLWRLYFLVMMITIAFAFIYGSSQ
jgi:predicted nucleic acid-binding Zn ribbon protein